MHTSRLIYLVIFALAFGLGVYLYKYAKALWIIVALMAFGLFTEYMVELNKHLDSQINENFIYNLYIPLEYLFYASFFYFININRLIKKSILISVPIFITIVFLLLKFDVSDFLKFNASIYILSSILTIVLSIWSLFLIRPLNSIKFIQHPLFWFCSGFIIFYAGILPFTVMQNYMELQNPDFFKEISDLIRKGLNFVLYSFIIIGFVCSHRMKKQL